MKVMEHKIAGYIGQGSMVAALVIFILVKFIL